MRIYNSQTHSKQEFAPIEEGKVRMYVCGPTVYDNIHIGNARTFISFDVIRRWLISSGFEVTFAQNLTDVDDKIINRANDQGRSAQEVAEEFSNKFIDVMRRANVLDPDVRPRATKEIGPMIAMIKTLIEQGHAYAADNGDVYFAVRSDPSYGEVSGRKIDDLMVGAHRGERGRARSFGFRPVEGRQARRAQLAVALGPGPSRLAHGVRGHGPSLPGHPHRHSRRRLDLAFPHRGTGPPGHLAWHQGFANTWMHTGMLLVNGEKMSKSLGQLLYAGRGFAEALRGRPAPAYAADPLSQPAGLLLGALGGRGELSGAHRRHLPQPQVGSRPCRGRAGRRAGRRAYRRYGKGGPRVRSLHGR